jgi:hypothetical protein
LANLSVDCNKQRSRINLMARLPCDSCGNWKHEEAAICPHCGARQDGQNSPVVKDQEPFSGEQEKKPALKVSADEARAILQVNAVSRPAAGIEDSRGGVAGYMLLPQTVGKKQPWEVFFTILAFPLIALTIFVVASYAWRFRYVSFRGLAQTGAPVAALAAFGLAILSGMSSIPAAIAIAGMFLAWIVREVIRVRRQPRL